MTTQINYFPVIKRTARVAGTDAAGVRFFMKICSVDKFKLVSTATFCKDEIIEICAILKKYSQ